MKNKIEVITNWQKLDEASKKDLEGNFGKILAAICLQNKEKGQTNDNLTLDK